MASKVTGRTNERGDYSRDASLQIQVSNAGERERERERERGRKSGWRTHGNRSLHRCMRTMTRCINHDETLSARHRVTPLSKSNFHLARGDDIKDFQPGGATPTAGQTWDDASSLIWPTRTTIVPNGCPVYTLEHSLETVETGATCFNAPPSWTAEMAWLPSEF